MGLQPSRHSKRLHVRLTAGVKAELARRATETGLPMSALARQLIEAGLRLGNGQSPSDDHRVLALAALVAAEQAVLAVAAVLPDGERRMAELAPRAAVAAEERLAAFREVER